MQNTEKNILLLSFDIEEFDLPEEYGTTIPEDDRMSVSTLGTERIIDVLDKTGVKATFFVTVFFAERAPELIARMVKSGHEVASHGLNHSFFDISHLALSKEKLEKISGTDVIGFRMARLAHVDDGDITAAGYRYESSVNPVWLPGRYNHLSASLLPSSDSSGLKHYPVSAVPFLRIPLFWLSFKNFPFFLYHGLTRFALKKVHYFNLYTHPWEYNESARDPKWHIPGYITRHAGTAYADRLEKLILSLREQGDFVTFRETL